MAEQKTDTRTYQSAIPSVSLVSVAGRTSLDMQRPKVVLVRARSDHAHRAMKPSSRYRWKRELTKQEIVIKLIEHLTMNP